MDQILLYINNTYSYNNHLDDYPYDIPTLHIYHYFLMPFDDNSLVFHLLTLVLDLLMDLFVTILLQHLYLMPCQNPLYLVNLQMDLDKVEIM